MADKPTGEDVEHAGLPPLTFIAPWVRGILIEETSEDIVAASRRHRAMTPSLTALYLLGFGFAVAGGVTWYFRRRK